eukprot:9990994-Alexandrium_andersonii.AAC.1
MAARRAWVLCVSRHQTVRSAKESGKGPAADARRLGHGLNPVVNSLGAGHVQDHLRLPGVGGNGRSERP